MCHCIYFAHEVFLFGSKTYLLIIHPLYDCEYIICRSTVPYTAPEAMCQQSSVYLFYTISGCISKVVASHADGCKVDSRLRLH